jgi:hypothetical protein
MTFTTAGMNGGRIKEMGRICGGRIKKKGCP